MIEYLHFTCSSDELEAKLNEAGSLGWRLHTCEPAVIVGDRGIGVITCFVVMDKMVTPEEDTSTVASEGIPMKG